MRNRIQKSMIFVVTMSLLISYILVTLVIYRQALDIRRSELVQEAEYPEKNILVPWIRSARIPG